mmetsp:Transcript_29404/g.49828  ORF Transcript_29404/g.49828 Transcript_29404/m.49828 type:complete len:163 (+) Transcript_29404:72-560(+)
MLLRRSMRTTITFRPAIVGRRLHRHVMEGDLRGLKQKLGRKVDPDEKDGDGNTALHLAAGGGLAPAIEILLDSGANPIVTNKKKQIPLHCAAVAGSGDCVRMLIKRAGAAQTKMKDREGKIPIMVASSEEAKGILRPFSGGFDERSGYGPGKDIFGEQDSAI